MNIAFIVICFILYSGEKVCSTYRVEFDMNKLYKVIPENPNMFKDKKPELKG